MNTNKDDEYYYYNNYYKDDEYYYYNNNYKDAYERHENCKNNYEEKLMAMNRKAVNRKAVITIIKNYIMQTIDFNNSSYKHLFEEMLMGKGKFVNKPLIQMSNRELEDLFYKFLAVRIRVI